MRAPHSRHAHPLHARLAFPDEPLFDKCKRVCRYRELLGFLKGAGAMLSGVRAEALLSDADYARVRLAHRGE